MEGPDDQERPSYYAVLNISKESSDEEVRRAYRSLAQVFHPDKHTDESLKKQAQEAFAVIQEAYEILSDPNRRQVYDIYGKEGLEAGMEVGEKLKGPNELKKDWEEFKKKQAQQRSEANTKHPGLFRVRLVARDIPEALRGRGQLFSAVAVQQGLETQLSDVDVVHFQGQAALMKGGAAGGNVVFGYSRTLSAADSIEASASVGLATLLSVTSTRQLSPYTTASVVGTWNPQEGPGIGISTSRQLPNSWKSTFGWTLGPSSSAGMQLALTKRTAGALVQTQLALGASTMLSCRATCALSEDYQLLAEVRLTLGGPELELGAIRKWHASHSQGLVAAQVSRRGVQLKGRYTRGEQIFEVPVLLSRDYDDPAVLAAAYLLPPVIYFCTTRYVVRPLGEWMRRRRERRAMQLHNEEVQVSLAKAQKEQELVRPVARRKARAAAGATEGIVVLHAVYGILPGDVFSTIREIPAEDEAAGRPSPKGEGKGEDVLQAAVGGAPPVIIFAPVEAEAEQAMPAAAPETGAAASENNGPQQGQGKEETEGEQAKKSSAVPSSSDVAPLDPWLEVTCALQYLVAGGKLVLHPGVSKCGLMGFCDPAPGVSGRELWVAYAAGGAIRSVRISDIERLDLPAAAGEGEAIVDPVLVRKLRRHALEVLGVDPLAPVVPPGSAVLEDVQVAGSDDGRLRQNPLYARFVGNSA